MITVLLSIDKWRQETLDNANKVIKNSEKLFHEAVLLTKEAAVKWTPVGDPSIWKYPPHKDYVPGTLKKSWEVEFSGATEATISNAVPYASRVEYGWSTQAPNGMLRRAVATYAKTINDLSVKYRI